MTGKPGVAVNRPLLQVADGDADVWPYPLFLMLVAVTLAEVGPPRVLGRGCWDSSVMAGCLGNVLRRRHVTEPEPKDHVVSPDA